MAPEFRGGALVRGLEDKAPNIADDAFIADNAVVIGDVSIGPQSSIWYGSVLRGDVGAIRIGARVNVQDLSLLHILYQWNCFPISLQNPSGSSIERR